MIVGGGKVWSVRLVNEHVSAPIKRLRGVMLVKWCLPLSWRNWMGLCFGRFIESDCPNDPVVSSKDAQ